MSETREFTVANTDAGLRIDHYLVEQDSGLSRSRIQALIKEKHILLNGKETKANIKLHTGDVISFYEPPAVSSETTAEDIALEVLFEDEHLIVVNKPAGLVVHPGPGHEGGTLVNALLHHCKKLSGIGGVERPGIVHRLDKETSGCIVAAKTDVAHQALADQFAGREVRKIYLALATGRFAKPQGQVDAELGRHPVHRQKMAVLRHGGREARTDWRVIKELTLPGGGVGTLVECTLHTGRTHQIRVHLKHILHPLLGDDVYGQRGNFPRQMLHAWKLGFTHPVTGQTLDFESPVPADFRALGVE